MRRSLVAVALWCLAPVTVAPTASAAEVEIISHGQEVALEDHLVPGKYVLFDFYADWCGPCRALDPHLRELAGRYDDRLVLRKVDVIDWDSAVARQYRLSSIPYLVLFGPDGSRLAAGDASTVLHRLEAGLGASGSPHPSSGHRIPVRSMLVIGVVIAAAAAIKVGVRRLGPRPGTASGRRAPMLPPIDTAANPGDPAIWFALLEGSLDGPFTRSQLAELVRRGALTRSSSVRRRGDADWRSLHDLLD
jgi:thiol-disulfide isomerase/thioredoxin